MTEHFKDMELPARIARLPRDPASNYPVPYFVAWIEGKPDFRIIDPERRVLCFNEKRCWVCGGTLGSSLAFLIGPMCAVNRTSAEPPSHRECAEFSAKVCPFMANPERPRRETNLPQHEEAAGIMLARNPGVSLLWMTRDYQLFKAPGGVLVRIGDPLEVAWYAKGRPATYVEVMASIRSGMPTLQKMADEEGPEAQEELELRLLEAMKLVPQPI